MNITNKRTMNSMWESGLFGNKIRSFPSIDDLRDACYKGLVTLRYLHPGGGGSFVKYNVPSDCIECVAADWKSKGVEYNRIIANESAPDDKLVLQGELQRCSRFGWSMRYSTEKAKMRDAMQSAIPVNGPSCLLILKSLMTPASYDDMLDLFELYPDSQVEFSIYSTRVGDCPGRNTLIWEVRNY